MPNDVAEQKPGYDPMLDGPDEPEEINKQAQGRLKSFVQRIENLNEEADRVKEDLKEVYAELKGEGFDTKVMRAVIKRRKQDKAKVQEFESLFDLYMASIGDI